VGSNRFFIRVGRNDNHRERDHNDRQLHNDEYGSTNKYSHTDRYDKHNYSICNIYFPSLNNFYSYSNRPGQSVLHLCDKYDHLSS
jgi:hypothetical protein